MSLRREEGGELPRREWKEMSRKGGGMDRGPHSSTGCSVNKAKNDAILAWLQLRL